MKCEWNKVSIKSLCIGIYDGPHATPPESDSGAVFLGISNFSNGRLDLSNIRYISESDLPRWTKRVVPRAHDIVFSYEATLNLYAIIPDGFYGCLGRRMALMRPDESKVDYRFLYYYMYSPGWKEEVERHKINGSTVDRIPLVSFPSFTVSLPDMATQKHIADILSALDDKIELNRKINENLEQQAQALYKAMFIDNSNVEATEGVLSDIAEITMGQSPTGSSYNAEGNGEIFYQGRAEFGFRFPTRRLFTTEPKRMAEANDVLLSVRAPVGDINVAYEKCCIGRGLGAIHSKDGNSSFLIYTMLSLRPLLDVFNGEGTVFGSINRDALNSIPICIPPKEAITKFETIVRPIDDLIRANYNENCRLQIIRDSLLPKLMSGKIDVSDIK